MSDTATYSPDDNKLRLYPAARLEADTYARVRAAGFIWAPKQGLFVAPAWTPERADLLLELAGDIGDEDTSLVDRAAERADRFETYREHRTEDAERAHAAVSALADAIPLGQPILVGHHSERHARRDAERIRSGMARAVKMWDTAQYWKARAAGALRAAKYKELPAVRHRRIKGLEADRRKQIKARDEARDVIRLWGKLRAPGKDGRPCDAALERTRALHFANYFSAGFGDWSDLDAGRITPRTAQLRALKVRGRIIAHAQRWIAHLDHRLAYERALLAEAGGLITDRTAQPIEAGGQVLIGREWLPVLRVNRKDGVIVSVTTAARFCGVRGIEAVKDYRPPTDTDRAAVATHLKLPPLCNYPGDGVIEMTAAEFKARTRASDFAGIETIKATATAGRHRRRRVPGQPYYMTKSVYLTDVKRTDPPPPSAPPPPLPRELEPTPAPVRHEAPAPTVYDGLRDTLKAGVTVAVVPHLFATPAPLARRVVDLADIQPGHRVLEPSAGTGALVDALPAGVDLTVIEVHAGLADRLETHGAIGRVIVGDFLERNHEAAFDRIVMNPPFDHGADIRHIEHARRFLRPGGRLVAICANGPRQRAALEPIAREWIDLPAGSFESAGTNVNAAIVVIDAEGGR